MAHVHHISPPETPQYPARDVQEYCSAESDPLRGSAAALAGHLNAERGEDVLRIAAEAVGSRFEALAGAQLLCASLANASNGGCLSFVVPRSPRLSAAKLCSQLV